MKTIGHHTLENQGNYKKLEESGPILAIYNQSKKKLPFLGQGYYFWDDNFEMAKYWGKRQYKGNYYVFEANLELKDEVFLDLVASRQNMRYFRELMNTFKKFNNNIEWPIGKFIEFIKSLEEKEDKEGGFPYKGIFPYHSIRAIDSTAKIIAKYQFAEGKTNYTDLNPRLVICLIKKNKLNLRRFRKLYPD